MRCSSVLRGGVAILGLLYRSANKVVILINVLCGITTLGDVSDSFIY